MGINRYILRVYTDISLANFLYEESFDSIEELSEFLDDQDIVDNGYGHTIAQT